MKKKLSTLLLASALCSGGAYAQNNYGGTNYDRPNFNYAGLGYAWQKLDNGCNQDGLFANGSVMVNEQVFVQGEYRSLGGSPCDSTSGSIGAGMRADFGTNSALYGLASVMYRRYEGVENDTDPGFGLSGGIRTMAAQGLELNAFAGFEKVDELEETFAGVGVNYWVTQEFSVTGDMSVTDEGTKGFSLGARMNF